ncbi:MULTISPECIES: molybdenum cofactor guanylyltransferase [Halanaerobium]|jgi:molybdopterin-guanine dinucleotide biosynthesis protein A|uniref:Probable molybdenum cofactor guanylyltransferase n=1 Tax=Halanaerobium kushneri TaxID=56779 RepID=A0A1N6YDT0_9FIRM|nr:MULTISPECIES: molybdenum cofactor guanylyltransferase [Halanaerobium]RCW50599.1 molybdenum cofactor guanylyltransferase [Halanaerobium sp. ST460_2HS_T2]SIR12656.1 molybdenum cofactor guanylyltransferase [Halanaerobium kushneri]
MPKINAVLLAGGESSRFGSDKALLPFAGKTLIEYIYDNLKTSFNRVIIVGSPVKYSFLKEAEIREDIYQNRGPLAGIYTGLYFSKSSYNFVCGCDMPFLNSKYFDFIHKQAAESPEAEIIVSCFNGYLEPLAAIYQRSLLSNIKSEILKNNLKIKSFYQKSRKKIIKEEILKRNFKLEKLFFNLNYPEDQSKAINYLKEEAESFD